MKLKAKKPFSWAHRGVEIEHFEAGQVIETEDKDLIEVSQREGWTGKTRESAAAPQGDAGPASQGDDTLAGGAAELDAGAAGSDAT